MSRIKNMSRGGWLVIGMVIAVLLVPTGMAAAAALKYTGIEGTSTNKADVTSASQLLTTEAKPADIVQTFPVAANSGEPLALVDAPPSGSGLIVDVVHIDTYDDPTPTEELAQVYVYLGTSNCSGWYTIWVTPNVSSLGELDIPMTPGAVVPAGDAVCVGSSGGVKASVTVSGYTVPSGDIPSAAMTKHTSLPDL
jgi:hypothetical protein